MTTNHDPEETRAVAVASMSLAYAVTGMLKQRGVLDQGAIANTFDVALLSVERAFPADDRSASIARLLLDLMAAGLTAHVDPLSSSTGPDERTPRHAAAS